MDMGIIMEQQQQSKQGQGARGSRFAAACGLLRQYIMKEQAGSGGAAVTMDLLPLPELAGERISKTMELFPQRAGTLKLKENSHERMLEPEIRAQLTIFYGGMTMVFDDFPADKADELMQLAGSFAAVPATSDVDGAGPQLGCQNDLVQPFLADMPVARKASLQRFLEKRKTRLAAADPYPVPARAAKGTGKTFGDGGAPWLGFNSAVLHMN